MIAGSQPLIVLDTDCHSAVLTLSTGLLAAGYQVIQSFDLHSAMTSVNGHQCGPDSCQCQMVVLLVYAQDDAPVILICNGENTQTMVHLVNSPNQPVSPARIEKLTQLFLSPSLKLDSSINEMG